MVNKKIIGVEDDLASCGYQGKVYQRPLGGNIRWPGRFYKIEQIRAADGDTTLSQNYAEASVVFIDGKDPQREYFNLAEILKDNRTSERQAQLLSRASSLRRQFESEATKAVNERREEIAFG